MKNPFTAMLAELNISLGNKLIAPSSSSEVDALSDKEEDKVGGMELPSDEEVTDLDDAETDLSKLTLDQIIAALQAIKKSQEQEADIGGQRIEPHSDFADVDPMDPPENVNPADNRMPDENLLDDEGIPALPGMRRSPEDEQLAGPKKSNPFSNDEEEDNLDDPEGASFDGFDADPEGDAGDVDLDKEGDDADPVDDFGADVTKGEDPMGGDDMGAEDEPDENHMGTIRAVKGAHLVYKRQAGDGTFSELWTYNIGEHVNDAIAIKKAIVAGTDIPENKLRSDDGTQSYELVTMGNAQLLKITGLPN
jgi:hypothetical protein